MMLFLSLQRNLLALQIIAPFSVVSYRVAQYKGLKYWGIDMGTFYTIYITIYHAFKTI